MNVDQNNPVHAQIARVINELKMARQPVTVFKVHELTGIDEYVIFMYFYENGLLRGK